MFIEGCSGDCHDRCPRHTLRPAVVDGGTVRDRFAELKHDRRTLIRDSDTVELLLNMQYSGLLCLPVYTS